MNYSNDDIQRSIVKAVDTLIEERLERDNKTRSEIGIVVDEPTGFSASVKILEQIYDCILPEHLHSWIQKNDVVIIQDRMNNGQRVIVGKTGDYLQEPSLVFHDEEQDILISGRDGIFDANEKMGTQGTVDEEEV